MSEEYFNSIISGSIQEFLVNLDKDGNGDIDWQEFKVL